MAGRAPSRGFFRQSVPAVDLSLERLTNRVPQDGYYYVVLGGEIKGRYRTKNQALNMYRALLKASGYVPPAPATLVDPARDTVERYMDELEAYWSESHRHARRGGKGRYK